MAEGVLFDIAGDIIQKLGSRAFRDIGLWWGLKDELKKLKATVSSIQAVLVDAEKKQALDEQVKDWLGKLQEVVYDADDLLDDFATEALRRQLMTGNRMAKEIMFHSFLVGIGGLGKTTLAQYVFSDENVKTHFELKLWVCVSEVFDLKVVVEKTLKSIGREPGNFELDQLQTSLRHEIRGKKYVLVLDDVWNEDLQKWTD
ncbi:hypothetical protein GH714_017240 [Hevea brasiliensis]|uniref:Disease resistance N-terminal domain-containing protein n=1 Tax=Hevea brasiliensis TaxID=3981 RepID=A0A6A6N2R9_HEVBR|nr:hypothetical protein GH714_017240 [Hevea brasiliensis]